MDRNLVKKLSILSPLTNYCNSKEAGTLLWTKHDAFFFQFTFLTPRRGWARFSKWVAPFSLGSAFLSITRTVQRCSQWRSSFASNSNPCLLWMTINLNKCWINLSEIFLILAITWYWFLHYFLPIVCCHRTVRARLACQSWQAPSVYKYWFRKKLAQLRIRRLIIKRGDTRTFFPLAYKWCHRGFQESTSWKLFNRFNFIDWPVPF